MNFYTKVEKRNKAGIPSFGGAGVGLKNLSSCIETALQLSI